MKKLFLLLLAPLLLFTLTISVYGSNAQSPASEQTVTKHVFGVHGLSCPFCVAGVKKIFKKIKGVQSVDVSLKNKTVTVYTDKGICFTEKELKSLFSKAGFTYHGTMVSTKDCDKLS